jgi:hypothetical protein
VVAPKHREKKAQKAPAPYTWSKTDMEKFNGRASTSQIKKCPGGTWGNS